jgi:arylsulfatase A-like enzyme
MDRRFFLKNIIVGSMFMIGPSSMPAKPGQTKQARPNVLFIFTDDQRADTIAALGNPNIITPNLDRLAKRSFVFDNAYSFGGNASAVCIPSRNMLMSGKVFFRFEQDADRCKKLGIKRRSKSFTNPDWPSFPKSMKSAGYETFYYEKSGSENNPDVREQFEHFKDAHEVELLKTGRPAKPLVDETIEFLKDKRDKARPFFIYLGMPCPHDPRWSTKQFRDMYDPAKIPLPKDYMPVQPNNITEMTCRDECLEAWPRTKEAIRRHLYDYYSLISSMDYDIGRLLDALDQLSLRDNTIIVFSSDQGLALGSHGLMGKQSIYEDVQKVPLFFCGPGIPKGRSDAFAYLHDIFPTICQMTGTPVPGGLDGISLVPIIKGDKRSVRQLAMLAYKNYQRSVRDQRWKLIRFPQINVTELYDLKNDPQETKNLADNSKYPEVVDRMMKLLKQQQEFYGDTVELTSPNPAPKEFIYPKKKMKTPYPAGGLAPVEVKQ